MNQGVLDKVIYGACHFGKAIILVSGYFSFEWWLAITWYK